MVKYIVETKGCETVDDFAGVVKHSGYEELERAALLRLGNAEMLRQSHVKLYKSFTRLRTLASERAAHAAYPGAAMLLLDAKSLALLAPSAAGALAALDVAHRSGGRPSGDAGTPGAAPPGLSRQRGRSRVVAS